MSSTPSRRPCRRPVRRSAPIRPVPRKRKPLRNVGRAVPLLPAVVLLVIFLLGPVISSFYGSFTNSALTGVGASDQQFVG